MVSGVIGMESREVMLSCWNCISASSASSSSSSVSQKDRLWRPSRAASALCRYARLTIEGRDDRVGAVVVVDWRRWINVEVDGRAGRADERDGAGLAMGKQEELRREGAIEG